MENKKLEQKAKKIDLKQWLPIYGIYKCYKESKNDKPCIMDREDLTSLAYNFYQAVSGFAVYSGLSELAENYFKIK